MLLPIVLLLAAAGPIQADSLAITARQNSQSSIPAPTFTLDSQSATPPRILSTAPPEENKFVRGPHRNRPTFDEGIVAPKASKGGAGCMSITAYVFSDGENPALQYVTDCPNLDVPAQTERARHRAPNSQPQPDLERTKN